MALVANPSRRAGCRSSLIHFAYIGVTPPRHVKPQTGFCLQRYQSRVVTSCRQNGLNKLDLARLYIVFTFYNHFNEEALFYWQFGRGGTPYWFNFIRGGTILLGKFGRRLVQFFYPCP